MSDDLVDRASAAATGSSPGPLTPTLTLKDTLVRRESGDRDTPIETDGRSPAKSLKP
jgi:hypothetical protein